MGNECDTNLPFICPDHPMAKIKHEFDESHYIMNGFTAGTGIRSNHKYYCNECGRELSDKPVDRREAGEGK